ncbi:MAG: DUF1343 domain-containing protein [Vicinamibacterales bacterium]
MSLVPFSPEHGIRGELDVEGIPSARTTPRPDSLYGDTRRPTPEMLQGIDTLVVDLQDVGVRFYTYLATMGYVLEEAAKAKIKVVVLDRPNPIDGWHGRPAGRGQPRSASSPTCRCRSVTA